MRKRLIINLYLYLFLQVDHHVGLADACHVYTETKKLIQEIKSIQL
jgi:hypothetical protein